MRPQSDGTLLIVTRDTTERQQAKARIEYLAYYDTLTGLPNRQLFVREVGRAIRSAAASQPPMALLYLDLDRFKRINDNLGHSVGDALLKNVARRLEQSIRPFDWSPPPDDRRTTRRAWRGWEAMNSWCCSPMSPMRRRPPRWPIESAVPGEPFDCGGHRFVVTPSIGIALYPQDGTDIEDLLVKADMAMYQAKDQGRNGHAFYGQSMAVRSLGRLELENDLRTRIRERRLPDLLPAEGGPCQWRDHRRGGAAALASRRRAAGSLPTFSSRWRRRPDSSSALGDWVIRETCKQLSAWAGKASATTIAVNVSVQQFAREDFVESVLRALWQYGVKPQQLELEITESLLMRNVDDTTACMKRFRAAGLTLSIDDFGTGYSSLGLPAAVPGGRPEDRPLLRQGPAHQRRRCGASAPPSSPWRASSSSR